MSAIHEASPRPLGLPVWVVLDEELIEAVVAGAPDVLMLEGGEQRERVWPAAAGAADQLLFKGSRGSIAIFLAGAALCQLVCEVLEAWVAGFPGDDDRRDIVERDCLVCALLWGARVRGG